MRYTFNYSDGRNYSESISEEIKIKTGKIGTENVLLKILSAQKSKTKITMTLSNKEAVAIAHCLLASTNSEISISAE